MQSQFDVCVVTPSGKNLHATLQHSQRAFVILVLLLLAPNGAHAQLNGIINDVLRGLTPQQAAPPPSYAPAAPPPHYPAPPGYPVPNYPPPRQSAARPNLETASPSGPVLAELQQMLNQLGYDAGTSSGSWGEQSARALRAFQGDHGQAPDGAVNAASRAAVRSVWYAQAHGTSRPVQAASDPDAAGPSFNCASASSWAERQICSNPNLAALDRTLAQAFARARAAGQENAALLANQRDWLARRNACQSDPVCLKRTMEERLAALAGPLQAPVAPSTAATVPAPVPMPAPVLASSSPMQPMAADTQRHPVRSLAGEWEGKYTCSEIANNSFDLAVTQNADGTLSGVFRFDVPNKPGQSGRFKLMGGAAGSDGQFTLAPSEWVDRPPGFAPVGMAGQVTANNLSAAGKLLGCESSSFEARRKNAAEAIQAAAPSPTPPEPGGPLEGTWRGEISCTSGRSSFTAPVIIAVSQQGSALAALVTEAVPDLRTGASNAVQGVFLSRAADGGSPLNTSIELTGKRQGNFPRSLTLDAARGTISAEMHMPNCTTAVTKSASSIPLSLGQAASLVGSWATPAPDSIRSSYRLGSSRAMTTMTTLLEFRFENGQLYGQIRAFYPTDKPPAEQDRLVASLRPLLVTEDGRIGFVITRRYLSEGAFDPASSTFSNPLAHGAMLLVQPPTSQQADLQVALSSDRGFAAETNMLFQHQNAGAAQAIATGGPPQALPAGFGGRIAQAKSLKEQCDVLAEWGRPVTSRADAMTKPVDQLQREALPLFENDAFVPVFGRPYIMLSAQQRVPVQRLLDSDCPGRLKMQGISHYDLTMPWGAQPEGSFAFAAVTAKMVERHDALSQVAAAIDRVRHLPETPDGLAELNQILRSTVPLNDLLSEQERAPFPGAVAENRTRIQNGMMRARIAAIGDLPESAASIDTLKMLLADVARSELSAPEQAKASQAIADRVQAIVQPVIAAANQRAGQAPASLGGLLEVTRIARDIGVLTSRLDARLGAPAAIQAAEPVFRRRRDIMADPGVSQAFQQAMLDAAQRGDPVAVTTAASRYLQPNELNGGGTIEYRRAIEAANSRVEEEQHKAAMAQDAPGADAVPLGSRSDQDSSQPGTGEPTGREMEAAVSNIAKGLSAGQDDLSGRCQRREFKDDPALAFMCLAQMGAGGPMHVGVTNFRKIACTRAQGQPGYVCDYSFGMNVAADRNMGVLSDMMRSGGNCTGRFVRTASQGWMLQERDCR